MITLKLSPSECWQYDTAISVSPTNEGLNPTALEFGFEYSRGYRVPLTNDSAVIPQVLMEHYGKLLVCAINASNDVIASGVIRVHRRPKPAEYVATDEYGEVSDIIESIAERWAQAKGEQLFAPLLAETRQVLDDAEEILAQASGAATAAQNAADAVEAQVNNLWFEVDSEDGGLNVLLHESGGA